jgi:hypothetical protein
VSIKIYAVNKGCYSDWRIVALFSTEEGAKLFMERHPDDSSYGGYNDIDIYYLDSGIEEMRKGASHFEVCMFENGDVWYSDQDPEDIGEPSTEFVTPPPPKPGIRPAYGGRKYFKWRGFANDEPHAIKIANEYRIGLLLREDAKP